MNKYEQTENFVEKILSLKLSDFREGYLTQNDILKLLNFAKTPR